MLTRQGSSISTTHLQANVHKGLKRRFQESTSSGPFLAEKRLALKKDIV